jgi:hypothetical protein
METVYMYIIAGLAMIAVAALAVMLIGLAIRSIRDALDI